MVDALAAVIIAPACAACAEMLAAPSAGPVCDACWHAIRPFSPPLCEVCGEPVPSLRSGVCCASCRRVARPVTRARAVGVYDHRLRDIIHALKYEQRRSLAGRLGELMRDHGADVLDGADAVVPVPLHWLRRHRRGFNQSALLAGALGLPVWNLLRRRRHTRAQVELPADARRANVVGAFALVRRLTICPGDGAGFRNTSVSGLYGNPPRPRCLARKIVVLVDDVSTTGATLDACARVLLAAGAAEVRALTAARVVPPGRSPV